MIAGYILGAITFAGLGCIFGIYAREQGDKEGYARGYGEGKRSMEEYCEKECLYRIR